LGVVAILIGGNPVEGTLLALGVGTVAGAIQGLVIARLSINSVPVTLVGYLVMLGLTGALLHEKSLAYPHYGVGLRLDLPIIHVLSIRSLVAIGGFVALGVLMAVTRLGPQIRALGSERRAARVAGLPVNRLLVAVFALSGALSATAGALLDFSLATASPQVQLTPLVFAVTAAVIGGVGLAGGRGSALGIGIGVIALSVLQEGLVILNASDNVTNIATGGLLFVVALVAAPQLRTALRVPWLTWRRGGVESGQGG
jgi:ribose transport system permease protein